MADSYSADVVIIGAGIAGLWLHNRLNNMGIHTILIENNQIGYAQTLSSQGIIHGGAKYALNGILSRATQAIGDMPARWKACLAGEGELDLTQAIQLTDHQLLWSKDKLSSKMMSFFASKALSSRMQQIAKEKAPELFQHPDFNGTLYELEEPVLDIKSVLSTLVSPWKNRILQLSSDTRYSFQKEGGSISSIRIGDELKVDAQHFVLTAGEGNEALLAGLEFTKPKMQRRPLQMVLCKSKVSSAPLPEIFAHSLGSGSKPIATITSHRDNQNNVVWYIGGDIAEQGVGKSPKDLIKEAKSLITQILPWFELPELQWATHPINRAEPKQSALSRPDTAFVESLNNLHVAWPTKLALAPDLSDKVIAKLKDNIQPKQHAEIPQRAPIQIADPLWNTLFHE
jgi:glycerol-3-phosphate dehydrogenase